MPAGNYVDFGYSSPIRETYFGVDNGRVPTATNVVVVVLLLGTCHQIFKVLKLFRFSTDRK